MGADQQFCLRWNNFHSNITSAFESLRDDEDFVDITLACEGRQIKAHKMVLSACSPYFRSLLKGNPCQHPIVFLKDVTFANLTSILDFMYHGEVNVSHNELATFLKTAEALKVRGLAEDEKKKDTDSYNESSSPPPPRGDPPDPGSSPRPEEAGSAPDTHLSGDSPPPPPSKRQRRRSGASLHSAEDNTSETVLSEGQRDSSASVKNEPQDYTEDEDMLGPAPATLEPQDLIKADLEDPDDRSFGPTDSVTISRSQAAMQQLQESFGSFLPGMGQAPGGFLPQGATDLPRPPPYPLEGVQGLPPGISALPGPSMSQGASQEGGQGGRRSLLHTACVCPYCNKVISNKYNLKTHILDKHTVQTERFPCELCGRVYSTKHSLATHTSTVHRGDRHHHHHHSHSHHHGQGHHHQHHQHHQHHHARVTPAPPLPVETRQQHQQQQHQQQTQPQPQPQPQQQAALGVGQLPPEQQGPVVAPGGGGGGPSLAEVAAQLPPAPLEGGPTHEQIQAMAQSLAQSLPSFQSFPGLE